MKGVKPGQLPIVSQPGADPAGKPVDEAVASATPARLVEDGLSEVRQQIEQLRFVHLAARANGEPGHPAPIGEPHPVRAGTAGLAGKHLSRNPPPAEFLAHRPQVDVHPAVFARPERSDR